jgi:glycolate oxidase FAD binding subunit
MDLRDELVEQVRNAFADREPLVIVGGGTKAFLGSPAGSSSVVRTAGHTGVLKYNPGELVIQARGGTSLAEIESHLAEHNQILGFEPPHFGPTATLGGCVAAGLSGPCRPYLGSLRDFLLGVSIINGRGELLSFGGQVMKNVAGYDVSRLMAGALGTLGVIVDVSLRVLPAPRRVETRSFASSASGALEIMRDLARMNLPLTGSCFVEDRLYVRLSGETVSLESAWNRIGGDPLEGGDDFWRSIREQEINFFKGAGDLWRLSVPPSAPLSEDMDLLVEWGGAQRWYRGADQVWARSQAESLGGQATLFRSADGTVERFQPLQPGIRRIHQRLKQAFDPAGVLNPGRMYAGL